MATIVDVAREAGVSTATISNHLNKTKPVSAEKRARIEDAIEKLNYLPNFSARNLKNSFNNEIGVVFPNLNDSYYAQILQGIEGYCRRNDYFVNITVSNEIPDIESDIVSNFIKKRVSGIILVSCQPENTAFFHQHISRNKMPFVHIDRRIKDFSANFLYADNYETVRGLISAYIKQGLRKIAILAGPRAYSCEYDAVSGYLSAFEDNGIAIDPNLVWQSILTKEAAFKATISILDKERPDVILTTSGRNAHGVLESLMLVGCRVPEDIIVASLGEDTWDIHASNVNIQSTMRPSIILGRNAAELLLRQIQEPDESDVISIKLRDRYNSSREVKPILHAIPSDCRIDGPDHSRFVGKSIRIVMTQSINAESLTGLLPHFRQITGINAVVKTLPSNRILDYILSERETGDISDIYMVDMPWFYTFADQGVIADISDYVNAPGFNKDIFLPSCFNYLAKFGDRYYGLPFISSPQIMYYRKDLFRSKVLGKEFENLYNHKLHLPRTWTEFNLVSGFFTAGVNPRSPVRFGTSIPAAHQECLFPDIMARFWAFGGLICDNNCRVTFDSPQTLRAYANLLQIMDYCPPDCFNKDYFESVNDFVNGETAMLVTFHSLLSNLVDLEKICLSNDIGYAHIPGMRSVLGGWSLCISQDSPRKDAAFRFIDWACGNSVANYMTLLTGQSAISRIYENDELIDLYPWFPLVRDIYTYAQAVVPPFTNGKKIVPYKEIKKLLYQSIRSLAADKLQAADTVRETHGELMKLFESCGYSQ